MEVRRPSSANQAVLWSILLGAWQIFAGAVSFVLLSHFLSDAERGYYMTFWSFLAVQVVIDLGLTIIVTNFASHEWAKLSLGDDGRLEGDADALSRLISIGRFAAAWFAIGAVVFLILGGLPGAYVFAADDDPSIRWQWPWVMIVSMTAVSITVVPGLSLLQGCGQVEPVYRFRLIQAVLTNFAVWTSLLFGAGLWTAVASVAMRLVSECVFLFGVYRQFFGQFWTQPAGPRVSFREELWSVQWRVSLGGVFSYFAYFLFNPVMMYYHSAELAGQMGMTRQLLQTAQTAAQSWIQTRVPEFGVLVARREYAALDTLFTRTFFRSTGALAVAILLFLCGLPILEFVAPSLRAALLDFGPCALIAAGMLLYQLPFAEVQYVRAHKKEPVFVAAIASNIAIGLAVWLAGWKFGAIGAAGGFALAVLAVAVPMFHHSAKKFRREYQKDHPALERAK